MKRKFIVIFEFIFIVVAITAILIVRNELNESRLVTSDNVTLAKISGNAILIDEKSDFSSPVKLKKNSTLNLEPGTYYFKESGFFRNRIRNFTISSRVILDLVEKNLSLEIINVGNVPVNLTKKQNQSSEILEVGEETEIAENESVEGKQK